MKKEQCYAFVGNWKHFENSLTQQEFRVYVNYTRKARKVYKI